MQTIFYVLVHNAQRRAVEKSFAETALPRAFRLVVRVVLSAFVIHARQAMKVSIEIIFVCV